MTYLKRAVITGVLLTLLVWLGTAFVAGTINMMEIPAPGRFALFVFWLFLQGANGIAWTCAYEDSSKTGSNKEIVDKYH